ncbi:MAG TPA: TonB-dependent receptor plug domain-containing protein [Bryobacteraceae bacterium]|nr:TonB-dependent receptor plug domain-containing protein [Bryobacteraceae bacterium]
MRTLILLSLSLAICAGETSNIHGTILDASGRPVEGARVSCQNQTVYSNVEGRFSIAGIDKCEAHIEKAGFVVATAPLAAHTEGKITLVVAGPVENVIVSATRAETTPEQATVAANVITEQQIAAANYPLVFDLLREVPGLQVSEYGRPGSLTQVYTRGAERTGTLVLIDGVPLNDPGGELHMENLTTEGIERVEVVRGSQSALYGAEAAAGVVQLFTKRGDPEDKTPHGSVSYERGNFQTDRWIASVTGGYGGRIDYSLSAVELHTVGAYQNDFFRDNSGTANLGYRISEATQVRGVFRIYDAHVGTPGQTAFGVDDTFPHEQTRDSNLSLRLDDSRGSNYLQRFTFGFNRLTDRFDDNAPFGTQPLAALVRDVPGPFPRVYFVELLNPLALPTASQVPPGLRVAKGTAFFGPSHSLNLTERRTAGYQGTLAYRGGVLVFGYDFQNQLGNLSGINADRDNHGFFANLQHSIGQRIFLSGGARVEHSSAFGTIGTGRGGASFLLLREHGVLSSTSFRVSGGRGVTEPSLLENFAKATFFHGNPALRPEETTSAEAAVVSEWFGRRVRTEVAGFRNSFHDLIAFVVNSWQNVQASWARGVETSVQARVHKNVLVSAGYMRLYTRITSSASPTSSTTGIGLELARRPRNSGFASVAVTPRRWSFVVGGRIVGERQDSDFSFGITRNPGYENVYASASYQAAKHLTPFFRTDNLLNERYQGVLGYQALSRRVIGGVRVHW